MRHSTTGLLLGSALALGLAGCATPNTTPSSDRPWYQQPVTCGIAGGLIGGSFGYAVSGSSDEEKGTARGANAGAAIGAMLCTDRSPEPVAAPEPDPMPEPAPAPVPEPEPVTLSGEVSFAFDSAALTPAAEVTLDDVAQRLREHTDVRIRIEGHTDSRGSAQYNLRLSEQRAQAVLDYLQSQGVDSTRMSAVGHGEERPVASNDTDEGRALNRRVEIDIH